MFHHDLKHVKPADEVAVMPVGGHSPHDVLKIARVQRIGRQLVHTSDGGMFHVAGGGDLNCGNTLYIEPATAAHRQAWQRKWQLRESSEVIREVRF